MSVLMDQHFPDFKSVTSGGIGIDDGGMYVTCRNREF